MLKTVLKSTVEHRYIAMSEDRKKCETVSGVMLNVLTNLNKITFIFVFIYFFQMDLQKLQKNQLIK